MNTTQTNRPKARPSHAQMWALIRQLLDAGLTPLGVDVEPEFGSIKIELPYNDRASVDRMHDLLGLPRAGLNLSHWWGKGEPGEFVVYGNYYSKDAAESLRLPRVAINVYCNWYTQADASAHWDGPAQLGCTDHRCHCGQSFTAMPLLSAVTS